MPTDGWGIRTSDNNHPSRSRSPRPTALRRQYRRFEICSLYAHVDKVRIRDARWDLPRIGPHGLVINRNRRSSLAGVRRMDVNDLRQLSVGFRQLSVGLRKRARQRRCRPDRQSRAGIDGEPSSGVSRGRVTCPGYDNGSVCVGVATLRGCSRAPQRHPRAPVTRHADGGLG